MTFALCCRLYLSDLAWSSLQQLAICSIVVVKWHLGRRLGRYHYGRIIKMYVKSNGWHTVVYCRLWEPYWVLVFQSHFERWWWPPSSFLSFRTYGRLHIAYSTISLGNSFHLHCSLLQPQDIIYSYVLLDPSSLKHFSCCSHNLQEVHPVSDPSSGHILRFSSYGVKVFCQLGPLCVSRIVFCPLLANVALERVIRCEPAVSNFDSLNWRRIWLIWRKVWVEYINMKGYWPSFPN